MNDSFNYQIWCSNLYTVTTPYLSFVIGLYGPYAGLLSRPLKWVTVHESRNTMDMWKDRETPIITTTDVSGLWWVSVFFYLQKIVRVQNFLRLFLLLRTFFFSTNINIYFKNQRGNIIVRHLPRIKRSFYGFKFKVETLRMKGRK